jgi:hypothetical protein
MKRHFFLDFQYLLVSYNIFFLIRTQGYMLFKKGLTMDTF